LDTSATAMSRPLIDTHVTAYFMLFWLDAPMPVVKLREQQVPRLGPQITYHIAGSRRNCE
jgi:hypothetical protein